MIDSASSQPFSATTTPPIKEPPISYYQQVIDTSRQQFSIIRKTVEQDVSDWHNDKASVVTQRKDEKKEIFRAPNKNIERKEPLPVKVIERPKYMPRVNVPPRQPVVPKPEPLDDDFVPLEELKPKVNIQASVVNNSQNINSVTKKAVNEKSLNELRAVLQSFKKDKPPEIKKDDSVIVENKIKEIPEETLKNMLHVSRE